MNNVMDLKLLTIGIYFHSTPIQYYNYVTLFGFDRLNLTSLTAKDFTKK